MDKALNETLAALPDDTKVYVRLPTSAIENHRELTLAYFSLAMSTPRAT